MARFARSALTLRVSALLLLMAISAPAGFGQNTAGDDVAPPDETAAETTPAAVAQTKKEVTTGASLESDYASKHFSLTTGAVLLNQWKLRTVPGATAGAPPTRFLDTGDTSANVLLEAGFRYRWAWLDRASVRQSLPSLLDLALAQQAQARKKRDAAEAAYLAAKKQNSVKDPCAAARRDRTREALDLVRACDALTAATAKTTVERIRLREAQLQVIRATRELADAENEYHTRKLELDIQRLQHPDDLEHATADIALADGRRTIARSLLSSKRAELTALSHSVAYWKQQQGTPPYYSFPSRFKLEGGTLLLPDDWGLRLGYAFTGDSNDLGAIAGASDLYIDVDLGWNLVQWSMRTASPEEIPIRGTVNLELGLSWDSDREALDVHQRTLIGLSAAFGVPLTAISTGDAAASIAEIVARIGAVHAETPEFIDSDSTQVALDNGLVDFKDGWGVGLDLEMNVPVPGNLGYVVLRGRLNGGFSPNPWAVTIGYTIPLQRIFGALTGGGGAG